jgi:hypothetical protein
VSSSVPPYLRRARLPVPFFKSSAAPNASHTGPAERAVLRMRSALATTLTDLHTGVTQTLGPPGTVPDVGAEFRDVAKVRKFCAPHELLAGEREPFVNATGSQTLILFSISRCIF